MRRRTGLAIVLAVLISIVTAVAEVSAYTQSYVTEWQTTDLGGGIYQYQYWVFNTGVGDYTSSQTIISDDPLTIEYYEYRATPLIWDYEVPILSQEALDSIVAGSIYQPYGWSFEFLDPTGIWTNATGNPLFDNPYRILHWYTGEPNPNPIFPPIPDAPPMPGYEFGYQTTFGAILGPDQTSWYLAVSESTWTAVYEPLPPVVGDPDEPFKSNGIGTGGGIPLALIAPQQGAPVPEPSTVLLVGAGLIGLGAWGRKRLAR